MAKFIKVHVLELKYDEAEIEDIFQPSFFLYRGIVLINTETILSVEQSGFTFGANIGMDVKKEYPELERINSGNFSTIKLNERSITVLESFENLCKELL